MRVLLKLTLKRSNRFFLINTILFFSVSFSACQKEFLEPVGGNVVTDSLAIYSLVPDSGNCASVVSSGTSETGVPYTTGNYKSISVHVSKKGYWLYPQTTSGGITYSGSGYFADTGTSSIKLYGTGTPVNAGAFDYPLNVNNVSCSFQNLVWPAGTLPPEDSIIISYYLANIGGTGYYQVATKGSGYRAGSSRNGAGDDVSLAANISPATSPYPPNSTALVVIKGLLHNYRSISDAQFKSFFSPGVYPFSKGTNNNAYLMSDGFYIQWTDGQGHQWNTLSGSAEQSNSSIKIISVTDYPDPLNYYVRVKLQFSCKVYSIDTGEMKQLSNGEFVGLFGKL